MLIVWKITQIKDNYLNIVNIDAQSNQEHKIYSIHNRNNEFLVSKYEV